MTKHFNGKMQKERIFAILGLHISKIICNFAAAKVCTMKRVFLFIYILCIGISVRADLLTDINDGLFKPEPLSEMTPLADGERYAQMDGNNVFAYSYKTGQLTDTLFEYAAAKGHKPAEIDGFLLSPSERYMLLYANSEKIYRHSFRADYYLYDRKRRELRALSDTMPVMQPVFSPDGKYIAFSRDNNLYIHKVEFKTEVPVTRDGGNGVLNGLPDWLYEEEFGTTCLYSFSPDSKQLAFVRLDESHVPLFSWTDYLGTGITDQPKQLSLHYPRAGEPNAEASVVVYDTYYKSLKTMALPEQRESYIPRLRWTNATDANPQGELAIFRLNRDQNRLEMFLANPKSTVCTRIYLEESKQYYVDYEAIDEWQFLTDNSFICVNETDGFRHAYLYSPTGIKQKQLTKGRYDVTKVYGYNEKTQTLYYQAADKDPMTRYIYALNTKKGSKQAYSQVPGTHNATFSPTLAYFVDAYQSVEHPTTYTLYNQAGMQLRVLKDNREIEERAIDANLPLKEFFSFTTSRGDTLNGWILLPAELQSQERADLFKNYNGKRFPVLMFHYSGPASQQVLNRWRIDWEEYLAAKEDVVCVCIDPRGTYARGRAFRNETYMQLGIREAEDQVAAAQHLQSLPFVDARRVGIWGWSYGGYATIMSLSACGINPSLAPDRKSPFAFGMAVAPVTDWRLYDSAYTERFMRRPQVNESGYKDGSAIEHATALQGNLLIIHGMADDNVHVRNTLLYAEALTQAGKQFEMQLIPDDNHFLRKRSNYRFVYQRLLKFLKEQHNENQLDQ